MRWSLREKDHRSDPEDKSYNTSKSEYGMQSQSKFSTEPTKEDRLSSV